MDPTERVGTLDIRVITEESEWDRLEPQWGELFESSPYASAPLRFDWLRQWWRLYESSCRGRGRGLRILAAWRDSQLVGVLPLYRHLDGRPVLGTRIINFLSTGEAEYEETCPDYLNLLCLSGEEAACLGAMRRVLIEMGWDSFELRDIPADSPLVQWGGLSFGRGRLRVLPRGNCPIANLTQGFESYLKSLSSNTRQQARRRLRAAERLGATLDLAESHTVDGFFDDLVRLHQERWTAEGKPGCFAAERFTTFHRNLAKHWIPSGKAILARLSLATKPLAVLYGFVTGSKFDFYQSGIRRDTMERLESPGTVAHLLLMTRLLERGVTHYDFLRGSSSYKERLANEQCQLVSLGCRRLTGRAIVNYTSRLLGRGVRKVFRLV